MENGPNKLCHGLYTCSLLFRFVLDKMQLYQILLQQWISV